jgi:hypothetical protein
MQTASQAALIVFAAFLGSWPVVCLVALLHHALAKRWRRVGQVALLLPLWMTAASLGLVQVAPIIASLDAPTPVRSPVVAVAAIACTLFLAALAWGLLVRSFGGARRPDGDEKNGV